MKPTPEIWLVVEMSGSEPSIALGSLDEAMLPPGHRQLESLLPAVDTLLRHHGLAPNQIAGCLTSRGPGSFTGLRTAFASLKGITLANSVPFETLDGAEALLLDTDPAPGVYAVLTELSPKKVVVSSFEVTESGLKGQGVEILPPDWNPSAETQVLVPRAETAVHLKDIPHRVHPLRASTLWRVRERAASLKRYSNAEELTLAAPDYYATAFTPPRPK